MKRVRSLAAITLGLATILFSASAPALAAASNGPGSGQALQIAPPLLTLTANPGQTIKAQLELSDITSGPLVVTNEIDDFVASGEGGTPKILTGNDSNNPFSLKNWIAPVPQFTLSPKQVLKLPVTITVPKDASPGGHYGVIRFTGVPPQLKGSGVSLSASLGALVLLTVRGKLINNLSIKEFSVNKDGKTGKVFQSTPINFIVRLQNNGNVQEAPSGRIIITDMFGKTVAGTNINVPPHYILPDSTREFTTSLNKSNLGTKKLFGLYHAKLTVAYGTGSTTEQVVTGSITFWVIPYEMIGIIIALLIIVFFAIRFWLKHYKRRIINQTSQRQHRKPTKRRRM